MTRQTLVSRAIFWLIVVFSSTRVILSQEPGWKTIPLGEPAKSLVGTSNGILIGDDTGNVLQFADFGHDRPTVLISAGEPIRKLAATPDGETVGVVFEDGRAKIFRGAGGSEVLLKGQLSEPITELKLMGRDVLIALGKSGTRYQLTTSSMSSEALGLKEPFALSPNGAYAAGVRDPEGAVVVDGKSKETVYVLRPAPNQISAVAFSPTNRLIAVADATSEGLIRVWDLRTGELKQTIGSPGDETVCLLFDEAEGSLTLIDVQGKTFQADLETGEVTSVAAAPLPRPAESGGWAAAALHYSAICSIDPAGNLVMPANAAPGFPMAGPQNAYTTVPVFVGTNRGRAVTPTFSGSLWKFLATTLGLGSMAIGLVAFVVAALWKGRVGAWVTALAALAIVGILGIGYAGNDVMRFDPDTKDLFAADVGGMSYGVCTVTVPSSGRKIGELNGPFRAWIFEQPEDPKAHIILAKSLVLDKEAFLTQLAGSIAKADAKEAFVFIHGYNVSFEDAVRRTAQLAVDLRFVGAPICFSWPSYALESCYFLDVRNADASVSALQAFLHDVSERSGASRIHVIAHSMGNRVLTSACELDPTILGGPKSVIQHVVMAAPDVDKQLFVDRIAPKMTGSAAAVTLYGSSRDKALKLSKEFNGQPRAGDTEPEVTCLPGICSIDASAVDTSLLGHGYVAEERSLVSDLYYLFAGKQPAERFGMVEVKHAGGTYWRILE